jgi:dienelactone hydrolase
MFVRYLALSLIVSAIACVAPLGAAPAAPPAVVTQPDELVPIQCLVIGGTTRGGRSPVHTDWIEARIVAGTFTPPEAGQTFTDPDGEEHTWERVGLKDNGWFQHRALRNGYAYLKVPLLTDRVMMLHAVGHSLVYVNGELRAGDPYQSGIVHLPVALRAGDNHLLFRCGRGKFQMKLTALRQDVFLAEHDATLPDLVVDSPIDVRGGVMLINATSQPVIGAKLSAHLQQNSEEPPTSVDLPTIAPMTARKVAFHLQTADPAKASDATVALQLFLGGSGQQPHDTMDVTLRARTPDDSQLRTFISDIDGSVQYYALRPAVAAGVAGVDTQEQPERPGMILALHGAAVHASGLVGHYKPKTWAHVVVPTNRRHFGFDWEDWGRLDFLEVLEHATAELQPDPARICVSGHSMGGHGTWHVGVTYASRWAGIAPSAGWVSFWSYTGAERFADASPIEQLLRRATTPSDTRALEKNLTPLGIYVLHGDQDDNVPVEQARIMRSALGAFHPNFAYYERPGAKHWWGSKCVDWEPMMRFLERQRRPASNTVRHLQFTTASPGVSSRCHWALIEDQQQRMLPSRIDLELDAENRTIKGTTENVRRLVIDLPMLSQTQDPETTADSPENQTEEVAEEQAAKKAPLLPADAPLHLVLDEQELRDIAWPADHKRLHLTRDADTWQVTDAPAATAKGPHRYGPFKDAFRHRILFVYGTAGTEEENAWSYAKARYDAETFWYRGNGSVDVIPDQAFDPRHEPDRNVILYGNADTNAAWQALLSAAPIQVQRGRIEVGDALYAGPEYACLFVYPRPGSNRALVGVVAGTDLPGLRLTDRLRFFLSGVGYPDWTVLHTRMLTEGMKGITATGFFNANWQLDPAASAP